MKEINTSVIVTTYNRHKALGKLLTSLSIQPTPLEIIITYSNKERDLHALDQEISMLEFLGHKLILRKKTKRDAVTGRNEAIKCSTKKYLFFCDDDNVVPYGVIDRLIFSLEKNKNIGFIGPKIITPNNKDKHYKNWSLKQVTIDAQQKNQTIEIKNKKLLFKNKIQVLNGISKNPIPVDFLVNSFLTKRDFIKNNFFDKEYIEYGTMEEIDYTWKKKCYVDFNCCIFHNRELTGGFRDTGKKHLGGFKLFAKKQFNIDIDGINNTN